MDNPQLTRQIMAVLGVLLMTGSIFTVMAAASEPLILDCSVSFDELPKEHFSVRLDEEAGRVTHAGEYETFVVPALFQAGQVVYHHRKNEGFGLRTIHQFIINRDTLRITQFVTSEGRTANNGSTKTGTGSCVASGGGNDKSDQSR
jgi:hypothetical protein